MQCYIMYMDILISMTIHLVTCFSTFYSVINGVLILTADVVKHNGNGFL